jgi:hypothetical protein
MSAVNHQFRLAVRLAETFASASTSLSGWAREAREVQRRTGRASAADRRESRRCLTMMINGRCAQTAVIPDGVTNGAKRPRADATLQPGAARSCDGKFLGISSRRSERN